MVKYGSASAALAAAALAFLAVATLCWDTAAATLPRLEHGAKNDDDGSLNLLVVGDWGRKGTHNQSRVAEQPNTENADGVTALLSVVAADSLPCLEVLIERMQDANRIMIRDGIFGSYNHQDCLTMNLQIKMCHQTTRVT